MILYNENRTLGQLGVNIAYNLITILIGFIALISFCLLIVGLAGAELSELQRFLS